MSDKKQYGLILPKKGQQKGEKAKASGTFNVFGDDSDDSDQETVGPRGPPSSSGSMIMRKQAKIDIAKSLQEDPTVYQYDEIYDEMQASKPQTLLKEKQKQLVKDKKPKYIGGLLKASEVRKKEDERRKERQVQKEREAEGAMYADKESFVTSAYKKKMLEMQEEEEREKREAAMEAMTDVTKQRDMSGFYRYLYRETAGTEVKAEPSEVKAEPPEVKAEPPEVKAVPPEVKVEPGESSGPSQCRDAVKQEPATSDSDSGSSSSDSSSSSEEDGGNSPKSPAIQRAKFTKRSATSNNYRKQRQASSSPGSDHELRPEQTKEKQSSSRDNKNRSRSPLNGRRKGQGSRSQSPDRKRKNNKSQSGERDSLDSSKRSQERKAHSDQSPGRKRRRERSRSQERQSRRERNAQVNGGKERELSEDNSPNRDGNHTISDILKDLRGEVDSADKENTEVRKKKPEKPKDPEKRFPHHNSAKDIEEARKRYLQRKLAKERQGLAG